jgi:hypothetical protein
VEGPYRDLGGGFARLTSTEGLRRAPKTLGSVEDALLELLRNSRDAAAENVYVASSLRARRYRALVVIDDGHGIPETHKHLIFEPGVTTRHLDPVLDHDRPHGAGLSLYHIKNVALSAEVLSTTSPTAIKTVFDTYSLPEKNLQSNSRPSKTNLIAVLKSFALQQGSPRLYYASPARILARLLKNRIIQKGRSSKWLQEQGERLGLKVSSRTVLRVISKEVPAAEEVAAGSPGWRGPAVRAETRNMPSGPILSLSKEDLAEVAVVLRRAARSGYMGLAGLHVEGRPGEIIIKARLYEPEEEYE